MTSRRAAPIPIAIIVIGSVAIAGAFVAAGFTPGEAYPAGGSGDVAPDPRDGAPPPTSVADQSPAGQTRIVSTSGSLSVTAAEGQVIRGKTSLDPGTDLTIGISADDPSRPFAESVAATVEDDGTFRGRYDLSDVSPGVELRIVVRHAGRELASRTAAVEAPADRGTSLDYDGERLTLRSDTERLVSGSTDLRAGSEVIVRLHGSGDQAFLHQRAATVQADGTFEASFDLSGIEEGTTFRVSVRHAGDRLTYAPGEITGSE